MASSFLERLFGGGAPETVVHKLPPMANYPTKEDAAFARQNGAFYGTGMESFANGQVANVLSLDKQTPVSAVGQSIPALTAPQNANAMDMTAAPAMPNSGMFADTYARAGLASRRSALAALGLDPRRFALDGMTKEGSTNVAGAYSAENDTGFAVPGGTPDGASTLVHESIHRGLQRLRQDDPEMQLKTQHGTISEEDLVRLIMERLMGDPEEPGKPDRYEPYGVGDTIEALEAAAAKRIAKSKPGGPW